MSIIAFLLIGLLAGWIASILVEGHGVGVVGDIVIGIVGALIGGFIFNILNIPAYGFWPSVGMAIIGAVILLYIANLFTRRTRPPNPLNR